MLLASLKRPSLIADVPELGGDAAFEDIWTRCLAILEYYKDQFPAATSGMRALKTLKRQICGGNRPSQGTHCCLNADDFRAELTSSQLTTPRLPLDPGRPSQTIKLAVFRHG